MADLNGSSGDDVIQPFGNNLVLALSATSAQGIWPVINVLINGTVVLSNVSITANDALGQTQLVSIALGGTPVSSVTIQYANDIQTVFGVEDRNIFLSSVTLNGHVLPPTSATYVRSLDGSVVPGQAEMYWGGNLNFTGSVVTSATATAGGTLSVDGLGGVDTVLLAGARSEYSISHTVSGYTVSRGGDTLNLANVERLDFQSGNNVALDLDGHAGTAAKIISALFGQSFLSNATFVGIGVSLLDQGMTPLQLAALAEATGLFHQLAGSTSNTDFVKLVYQNVVGTAPSAEQLSAYVGLLNSGAFTQASLGLLAAETAANQAHLVGVVQGGIEFV